jgi:hypothetical protein
LGRNSDRKNFGARGHPPKLVSDNIKEEHKFGGWKPDGETGEAGGRTVVREVWVGRGCVPLYLH